MPVQKCCCKGCCCIEVQFAQLAAVYQLRAPTWSFDPVRISYVTDHYELLVMNAAAEWILVASTNAMSETCPPSRLDEWNLQPDSEFYITSFGCGACTSTKRCIAQFSSNYYCEDDPPAWSAPVVDWVKCTDAPIIPGWIITRINDTTFTATILVEVNVECTDDTDCSEGMFTTPDPPADAPPCPQCSCSYVVLVSDASLWWEGPSFLTESVRMVFFSYNLTLAGFWTLNGDPSWRLLNDPRFDGTQASETPCPEGPWTSSGVTATLAGSALNLLSLEFRGGSFGFSCTVRMDVMGEMHVLKCADNLYRLYASSTNAKVWVRLDALCADNSADGYYLLAPEIDGAMVSWDDVGAGAADYIAPRLPNNVGAVVCADRIWGRVTIPSRCSRLRLKLFWSPSSCTEADFVFLSYHDFGGVITHHDNDPGFSVLPLKLCRWASCGDCVTDTCVTCQAVIPLTCPSAIICDVVTDGNTYTFTLSRGARAYTGEFSAGGITYAASLFCDPVVDCDGAPGWVITLTDEWGEEVWRGKLCGTCCPSMGAYLKTSGSLDATVTLS